MGENQKDIKSKSFYIETYGCQMNFADSEIVNAILIEKGMHPVRDAELADIILVNTCSIRENAETRVWNRLKEFRRLKAQNKLYPILIYPSCLTTTPK